MKKFITTAAVVVLSCAPAFAQTPAQSGPGNNAINTPDQNNARGPVEGANSFTEGQARAQIEEKGYGNVSQLRKDAQGIWRGTAQKDGKPVNIAVDFQGNVIAD